jgi:hypothetical protein
MLSHPMPTALVKESLGWSLGFLAPVATAMEMSRACSAASEGELSPVEM